MKMMRKNRQMFVMMVKKQNVKVLFLEKEKITLETYRHTHTHTLKQTNTITTMRKKTHFFFSVMNKLMVKIELMENHYQLKNIIEN